MTTTKEAKLPRRRTKQVRPLFDGAEWTFDLIRKVHDACGEIAIGVTFSPSVARLMRGQVLATKNHLYIDAAEQFGSPTWRTVLRHVLPNAIQPIIVQAALLLAVAFLAEAALSFIGLGAQPPTASWGGMLARSAQFLRVAPDVQVYAPGVAITLTVLAINALGDSLRDSLDPVAGTERRVRRAIAKARRARTGGR